MTQMTGTLGARYLYDGDEIAGVVVAPTGTAIANRIVRGPWPDELLVAYQGATASTPLWSLQDHQGSIIAITDAAGTAPYTLGYDEYGQPRAGNAGRLMYTGQLWLPDWGLYHYKARAYHPGLGRFVQTDPVGYAQGMNLYAYVGNDPVNRTDPSGMMAQTGPTPAPAPTYDPNAPISQCQPLQDVIEEATEVSDVVVTNNRPPRAPQPRVGIGIGSIYLVINGNRILGAPFPYPYIYYSQGSGGSQAAGQSGGPNRGGLKRPSRSRLEAAARRDGYSRIEDWKTQDLGLNSTSDIVADVDGNLYAIPRQGAGEPQALGVRLP